MTLHMAIHLFSLPALLGGRNMEKARNVSPFRAFALPFYPLSPCSWRSIFSTITSKISPWAAQYSNTFQGMSVW